jgi:hypothetical protein
MNSKSFAFLILLFCSLNSFASKSDSVHVYIFLSETCPICQSTTLSLKTIINEFENKVEEYLNRSISVSIPQQRMSILEDTLFTIHRAHFNFLNIHEEKHIKINELFLRIVGAMVETFNKPTADLSAKITEIEKTIFLKDHRAVLLEELYFIKSQSRILKKVLHITQNVIRLLNLPILKAW